MDGSEMRGRASSMKMLAALDLFSVERAVISTAELSAELGLPRATAYRYLKTLCESGLLLRLGNSDFCLGPRIVQLDRQIQLSDPMIAASRAPMQEALAEGGWDGMLLCSFVRDFVLCTHQEVRPNSEVRLKRARGMPFPMFRGPSSLIIVAYLPVESVRRLYLRALEGGDPSLAALGPDWEAVRKRLRAIRRQGFAVSHNEFQTGLTGISAPLFDPRGRIMGSIAGVLSQGAAAQRDEGEMAASIMACARRIGEGLKVRLQ